MIIRKIYYYPFITLFMQTMQSINGFINSKLLAIGLCSLFLFTSYALAIPEMRGGEENERVQINENIADDLYAAGENIEVKGTVAGDAVIAGMNIIIEKNVEQDALLAGYHIEIKGNVGDDVRVAAHETFISGDVKDDIFVAGKTIELNGSKVGGSIFIAGKEVKIINITAQEGIKIKAEKIFFDSEVSGVVDLKAREIEFGQNAKINGVLMIYPHTITGNTNLESIVSGEIIKVEMKEQKHSFLEKGIWVMGGYLLSLIIFSLALFLLIPQFFTKVSDNIKTRPWVSLGLGWGYFIFTPIIAILLIMTLIGFPFGLFFAGFYGLLFIIFPYISSATLAAFFISKCKDAGLMKKIFAIIISSLIVMIPFVLIIIAPLVMGGILKEKFTMLKNYR